MRRESIDVSLFLAIAFLLPLVSILMQSLIENGMISFVFFGIEVASPTIATFIVLWKKKNIKCFFKQMFHHDNLLKAIGIYTIIACFIMLFAKLLYCLLFSMEFSIGWISFSQFIIILWALIAEEWGWRGYMEPPFMSMNIKKQYVPLLVGVIWCLLHYHFFLANGMQLPFLLFLISCIVESYIYPELFMRIKESLKYIYNQGNILYQKFSTISHTTKGAA